MLGGHAPCVSIIDASYILHTTHTVLKTYGSVHVSLAFSQPARLRFETEIGFQSKTQNLTQTQLHLWVDLFMVIIAIICICISGHAVISWTVWFAVSFVLCDVQVLDMMVRYALKRVVNCTTMEECESFIRRRSPSDQQHSNQDSEWMMVNFSSPMKYIGDVPYDSVTWWRFGHRHPM